jgi:hypothetical protein
MKVALDVVGQLLRQDEDAVERRPELMRHVGEELRLVLGGEGQFGGLLFHGTAGFLDLAVLALHLGVLLGELLGLLGQLLVGLCSSRCWVCNSVASCCDCTSSPRSAS